MSADDNLMIANVSRRRFLMGLAGGSALVLAARWDVALAGNEKAQFGAGAMPGGWVDDPNVFIHIDADGLVTIVNNRSEMGQGIRTSLVMVGADELGRRGRRGGGVAGRALGAAAARLGPSALPRPRVLVPIAPLGARCGRHG